MKKHSVKIFVKESNINFHNWYTTAESFHNPFFIKNVGRVKLDWVMKIEQDRGEWGLNEQEWEKAGTLLSKRLQNEKVDIYGIEKKHYQVGKNIWVITKPAYEGRLGKISTPGLHKMLKKMWKNYYDLNGAGYIAVVSDLGHGFLMGQLSKILLQKKLSMGQIQKFQALLSSPNKESLFLKEKLELTKLCRKYKSLSKFKIGNGLNRHFNKWFWLNYGYQGPAWTKDDFINRAQEIFRIKNLNQYIKKQQKELPLLRLEQKKLTKKLNLTKNQNYFFETARLFTFLKSYRIETRHRYSYALDRIFIELGKRLHLPLSFFRYATKEEISNAIMGKKIQNEEILKRKQKMLYYLDNLKGKFVKYSNVDKVFGSILKKEKINFSGQITGQTAYPGKVKGKVKILESAKDVGKVCKGDIIITFATTPDFLPAMAMAAAFVTDQGGVTSHAAITARELKKPCIIGTGHGTKVFKDGDIVEVDANKGIVRKIK